MTSSSTTRCLLVSYSNPLSSLLTPGCRREPPGFACRRRDRAPYAEGLETVVVSHAGGAHGRFHPGSLRLFVRGERGRRMGIPLTDHLIEHHAGGGTRDRRRRADTGHGGDQAANEHWDHECLLHGGVGGAAGVSGADGGETRVVESP